MSTTFEELLNCCRCCSKYLVGDQKAVTISKAIKCRFLQLTEIELLDSEYYSNVICESCNSKLSEFSDFRSELTDYQMKLYDMCIEEEAVELDEEEYLLDVDAIKSENDEAAVTTEIEAIGEDEIIVEEEEEIDGQYNEEEYSEMIIASNSNNSTIYQELSEHEPKYEFHITVPQFQPAHRKTSEKTKMCEVCNQTLAASGIYHHMMRFHTKDRRFRCDYCGAGYNLKNDLIMHIQKHMNRANRKKYFCSVCGAALLSHSALSNHTKLFHSDFHESHPCDYCHKEFKSRMKYLQHKKLVHESTGEFRCPNPECQSVFSTRSYLEKHIENVHGELKPCVHCGKMYKPASLKRHLLSHSDRKFKCTYPNCDKIYQMKISLKHHISAHHENQGNINCEHCGTGFPTKRHLTRHIQRQHTSEKLQCDVVGCTSLFSRKDYLVEHYKKHKDIDEETRSELLARVKAIKAISW